MGNLFGKSSSSRKPKSSQITETDRAVLSLKTQRKRLEDQSKLLDKRITLHVEAAKQLISEHKKDRALLVLKKKALTEKQLASVQALILNVESTLVSVEQSQQQAAVFDALKQGNEAIKAMQKELSVEDVQQLMDDTAEAKQYQDEVSALLAGSLAPEEAQAAEAELAELEEMMEEAERLQQLASPELPSPPKVPAEAAAAPEAATEHAQQQEQEEAGGNEREEALLAA